MNGWKSGVNVQGALIRTIRFADDITMLVESREKLEKTLSVLDRTLRSKLRISMNRSKIEVMVFIRWERNPTDINVGDEEIKEMNVFECFNNVIIQHGGRSTREVKRRS